MLHLKNLSSTECFNTSKPWRFVNLGTVPADCFKNKGNRDAWINFPETSYNVYSLYEGVQGNLRLRASKAGADDNPPFLMYGLAADYDTAMSVADAIRAFPAMGEMLPNWFEQTLSDNGRLIWLFDEPLRIPSRKFLLKLLEKLQDLVPFRKLAALDEPAYKSPERYFTNGCRWTALSRRKVPAALLRGFVLKASETFDWTSKEFGKAVSLPDIEAECRRQFPKFSEWQGDFALGMQGPSFWIDGSTSPKSAIIRETGMQTFSAHASKPFYSWSEIVGAKFVENNEAERLGRAVEGIYWDDKNFILKDGHGNYAFHSKDTLRMQLMGRRGLKGGAKKDGTLNEVESAMNHIMTFNRITGASSCAFYPHGIIAHNGTRILNTHQIEAMKPHPEASEWGPNGKFPWLSHFLDTFFDPAPVQRDRFLGWWQYFYRSCLDRSPRSGHGLFIAGGVGIGKTFLSRGLIGASVGGFAEMNKYLTDSDDFNSELFDKGLWVVDDGSLSSSERSHALYSENLKRIIANRDHRSNEKFKKAVNTPWQGRAVVTLNLDPNSMRMVPSTDMSMLEKISIFRAVEFPQVKFLDQAEMEALIQRELPHLLRWLLDWTPPVHCFEGSDVRFGIAPFHEESVLRAANLSSGKTVFVEIVTRWLNEYFTNSPKETHWEGSATDLRMAMSLDSVYAELLRSYKPEQIPTMLVNSRAKGALSMDIIDEGNIRRFRITRPTPAISGPTNSVPQAEHSIFQR